MELRLLQHAEGPRLDEGLVRDESCSTRLCGVLRGPGRTSFAVTYAAQPDAALAPYSVYAVTYAAQPDAALTVAAAS